MIDKTVYTDNIKKSLTIMQKIIVNIMQITECIDTINATNETYNEIKQLAVDIETQYQKTIEGLVAFNKDYAQFQVTSKELEQDCDKANTNYEIMKTITTKINDEYQNLNATEIKATRPDLSSPINVQLALDTLYTSITQLKEVCNNLSGESIECTYPDEPNIKTVQQAINEISYYIEDLKGSITSLKQTLSNYDENGLFHRNDNIINTVYQGTEGYFITKYSNDSSTSQWCYLHITKNNCTIVLKATDFTQYNNIFLINDTNEPINVLLYVAYLSTKDFVTEKQDLFVVHDSGIAVDFCEVAKTLTYGFTQVQLIRWSGNFINYISFDEV